MSDLQHMIEFAEFASSANDMGEVLVKGLWLARLLRELALAREVVACAKDHNTEVATSPSLRCALADYKAFTTKTDAEGK